MLEELINIAQTPKTDFAISMNMTPSGLSKILKGGRLPLLKEKKAFSNQAAGYFAEVLYSNCCYLKFEHIIPVIYDFSSKYELEMFLSYAIEYAFEKDFVEENNINPGYPDSDACFLGKKNILNMFCVIISDHIMNDDGFSLEFYSTLPLLDCLYSDIFHRIKISGPIKQKSVPFNHFFDMSGIEAAYTDHKIGILSSIVNAQKFVDLILWNTPEETGSPFLLLKGQFLMLFSIQLDGTPLMTFITYKSYLITFFNSLIRKNARKISFNGKEAAAGLEADPSLLTKLINKRIDAVYNFISIGYLIKEKELEHAEGSVNIQKSILKLFHSILAKETVFYVTIDAMIGFCATGKAIVPLIGAIDFPPKERIPYLKRFDSFIDDKSPVKFRIVNSELPKAAVLCSNGMSLIYMIDHEYKSEKIHYFETDMINDILSSELAESTMKLLHFSHDLWSSHLEDMSKNLPGTDL